MDTKDFLIEKEINGTQAVVMLASGTWENAKNSVVFARTKDTNDNGNYQYEAFFYYDGGNDPSTTGWRTETGNLKLNCRDKKFEFQKDENLDEEEKFEEELFDGMKQAENPFNLLTVKSFGKEFPIVENPSEISKRLSLFLPKDYSSKQAVKDFWASGLYVQNFEVKGAFDTHPNPEKKSPFEMAAELFKIHQNPYISSLRWENGKFDQEFADEVINIFKARFSRSCKKWTISHPHKARYNLHNDYKYRISFLHNENKKNYKNAIKIADYMQEIGKWTQEQHDDAIKHFQTLSEKIGTKDFSNVKDVYVRSY